MPLPPAKSPADVAQGVAVTLASAPGPSLLTARTLKVYSVPLVKPVKVWEVLVLAVTHVPSSADTS